MLLAFNCLSNVACNVYAPYSGDAGHLISLPFLPFRHRSGKVNIAIFRRDIQFEGRTGVPEIKKNCHAVP
jgi:hypothetical protein